MLEIHTLSASGQGHSRWLYQLALRKLHWSTLAVPKQVWQQLTEQVCLFATIHSTAIRGFWLLVVHHPYLLAFSSRIAGGGKA